MSLLSIEHLNKAFGGLQATNDVSLSLQPGELSAIIGPNGAGKSTLFNLITGYHRPDSGSVIFNGRNLIGMQPHEIVRLGIGRSFQRSNIFPRLTAWENVQTAVFSQHRQSGHLWRSTSRFGNLNEQVERILHSVGLWEKHERLGGKLALGDQKRLEMGLALALDPKLLLLDEPTAGMSSEETASTVSLIKKISDEFKVTLLFTEHDMAVVFGIAQTIHVLYYGGIVVSGKPQEIADNPEVQKIYLGEKDAKSRFRG